MGTPNLEVEPGTVGILAFLLAGRILEALAHKGILTDAEGADICRKALEGIREDQRQAARDILRFIWPDVRT